MKILIARLGRVDYQNAVEVQERLMSLRQNGKACDTLILLEHPPVLTVGRRGSEANILVPVETLRANGVGVHEVSRGGDVTYHGPGQIVGYPVFNLGNFGKDIKDFVWKIEEVIIRLLKNEFGIEAFRDEKKYTGVWVGDNKITAIGIAVKKWVTMHGFAFNVNTDLSHFQWINPCGITDKGVTSLQKLVGEKLDFDRMNDMVCRYFGEIFGVETEEITKDEFYKMLGGDEGCINPSQTG